MKTPRCEWRLQRAGAVVLVAAVTASFFGAFGVGSGMENPALRGVLIYLYLMVVFRITGRRTLGEVTTFDFVLLLIIGEATQEALVGKDPTFGDALLVIGALIAIEIVLTQLKHRFPKVDRVLDGAPLVLLENGRPIKAHMDPEGIDEEDILEAARTSQGIERLEQIRFAVLERGGEISIIPA